MTNSFLRKTIAILIILHFIVPAELVCSSFGYVTVEFNFIDYSGNPITNYMLKGDIYDENANLVSTVYGGTYINSNRATLDAFKTYNIRMTLINESEQEDDPVITRTFKTRAGYKIVTFKLPEKLVA